MSAVHCLFSTLGFNFSRYMFRVRLSGGLSQCLITQFRRQKSVPAFPSALQCLISTGAHASWAMSDNRRGRRGRWIWFLKAAQIVKKKWLAVTGSASCLTFVQNFRALQQNLLLSAPQPNFSVYSNYSSVPQLHPFHIACSLMQFCYSMYQALLILCTFL